MGNEPKTLLSVLGHVVPHDFTRALAGPKPHTPCTEQALRPLYTNRHCLRHTGQMLTVLCPKFLCFLLTIQSLLLLYKQNVSFEIIKDKICRIRCWGNIFMLIKLKKRLHESKLNSVSPFLGIGVALIMLTIEWFLFLVLL